ncbi:hypothetical protein NBRC116587_06120 [Pseudoteredinibacter isoporae]
MNELDEEECRILVEFYNDSNAEAWDVESTWQNFDVHKWRGITIENGHVVEIDIHPSSGGVKHNNQGVIGGTLSANFSSLSELRKLRVSGQNLRGEIPHQLSKLKNIEYISFEKNKLTGLVPEIFSGMSSLKFVNLSFNDLEGEILNKFVHNERLSEIRLRNNRFKERIPDSIGNLKDLEYLRLDVNRFFGEVPGSFANLKNLKFLSLNGNYFLWGDIGKWMYGLESAFYIAIRGNQFWGEIPKEFKTFSSLTHLDVAENHIVGDIRAGLYDPSKMVFSLIDRQSMVAGQEDIKGINLRLLGGGLATLTPRVRGAGVKVFIVPGENSKIGTVEGCGGSLKRSIYFIPDTSENCTVRVVFSSCSSKACEPNLGKTNNVPNVSLENPSDKRVLSGVVQLRGWSRDQEWYTEFLSNSSNERFAYIRLDNQPKIRVRVSSFRADVVQSMGLSDFEQDRNFAWSYLFNSASLSNGKHRIRVYGASDLLWVDREFNVFNPTINGEYQYISGVTKSVTVKDFPIEGHSSVIEFNQAQQSFTISDQMDGNGRSVTSREVHFINSQAERSVHADDDSIAKIENPNASMVFSGVQSVRGWLRTGLTEADGRLSESPKLVFDGGAELDVVRENRSDVGEVFGYGYTSLLGWSVLGYSGTLKNGWHKLELKSRTFFGVKSYVYRDVEFLSFTPVNENGEQFYVRSYDKDILVEDFPYQGSDVTLRFDPAGQNFVMVDQYIH